MANARKLALKALLSVSQDGAYSNITLNNLLKENEVPKTDASFIAALFYGVLDRTITLEYVLSQYIRTPLKKVPQISLCVLKLSLYQIMYMDKVPARAAVDEAVKLIKSSKERYNSAFVNGVLRNILRNEIKLPQDNSAPSLSVRYSVPQNIVESFVDDFGEDNAIAILEDSLKRPPIVLKVNTTKTSTDELIGLLTAEGVSVEKSEFPNSVIVNGSINIAKSKCYKNGLFYVQDLASQMAVSALEPKANERILDICSAPGGKSFAAAISMENCGEIISCDIYENKIDLIKNGVERLGLDIINPKVSDALTYNKELGLFDKVICDVPCSGWGVIRRKPEIKYKHIESFEELQSIQTGILNNAMKYLKLGGLLMYSTCTLRNSENGAIVRAYLDKNAGCELKYERTYMPHIDGTDGFYCAIIKKAGDINR